MPRIARVIIPDVPHHITQRGNFSHNIFNENEDRQMYIYLINEHKKVLDIDILSYCLMNNHVHFIIVPHNITSLGILFNQVSMRYAQYFNKKLNRKGHMWQDRYYSCPMDNDHLYEAIRYVENNPVNAGIVKYAEKYPWSGAKSHVYQNDTEGIILTDYTNFIEEIKDWKNYLRETGVPKIITNIKKCTSNGRPAGNDLFVKEIESRTGRILKIKSKGRPKKVK